MSKPTEAIPVSLVVRLAKEKATEEEAQPFLLLLYEATRGVKNDAMIWEAIDEIKEYFKSKAPAPLVQMQLGENNGTINTMDKCGITLLGWAPTEIDCQFVFVKQCHFYGHLCFIFHIFIPFLNVIHVDFLVRLLMSIINQLNETGWNQRICIPN